MNPKHSRNLSFTCGRLYKVLGGRRAVGTRVRTLGNWELTTTPPLPRHAIIILAYNCASELQRPQSLLPTLTETKLFLN